MAEIRQIKGHTVVDYMARDYDSLLRSMRELVPERLPEWTEYQSEADFGNVLLQLFAHMGDILSYYQDRVANESFLGTAQTRRSIIHHLRLIGYRLATAAPASAELTLAFPATCTETVTIRRGDAFATKSAADRPSVRFEFNAEQPKIIHCDQLAVDGATGKKLVRELRVEEGMLIADDFVGTSDGSPNQRFLLSHAGLILSGLGQGAVNRDIILRSELGDTITDWTLRETLAFSRAGQTDFSVDVDENDQGTVFFGDGEVGAIPPAGALLRATYRVGGGSHGNVPSETIATIADAPQLSLLAATVTNPLASTGGADRETIPRAIEHAPSVFRSLKRAVTAENYEALALGFRGVGKVRALKRNWNTVALYVAPEGGGQVSDTLRANLLAYFEDLRPVSTLIEIEDVDYVEIFVTAQVAVTSYYAREQIAEVVGRAAGDLLAFENVLFGQPVYLSKFYERIEGIPGVEFVNVSEFRRQEQPANSVEPSGKIVLRPHEIPVGARAYAGAIRVVATGGF